MGAPPTSPKWPTSIDDVSTLFWVANTAVLTVKYWVKTTDTQFVVNEDCTGYQTPLFVIFESGEIWYVTNIGKSGTEWYFAVADPTTQRGVFGSPIVPHSPGERVFVGLLSAHLNQIKRAIKAVEKQRVRSTTRWSNAQPGQAVIDNNRLYVSFTANAWTAIPHDHSHLTGLLDDDHPQYVYGSTAYPYTSTEASQWHNALGSHIANGDNHDHNRPNEGAPVVRVRYGTLSERGNPVGVGDMYFATDVDGGTLYISRDGSTWSGIIAVPSGAIAMFMGDCPAGWSRFTPLDDKFPMGASSSGQSGGAVSHSHTYTSILTHYHSVSGGTITLSDSGTHTHWVAGKSAASGGDGMLVGYGGSNVATLSEGGHSHTATASSVTTGSTGVITPSTSTSNHLPPYQEVVFCKKD